MRIPLFVVAFFALCLLGCSADKKWAGQYEAKISITSMETGTSQVETNQTLDRKVTLDLRPDHTFTENLGRLVVDGTWKLEGDSLTTTPTKVTIDGETVTRELSATMYKPVTMQLEGDKIASRAEGQEYIFTRTN